MSEKRIRRIELIAAVISIVLSLSVALVFVGVYKERINNNEQYMELLRTQTNQRLDRIQSKLTFIQHLMMNGRASNSITGQKTKGKHEYQKIYSNWDSIPDISAVP